MDRLISPRLIDAGNDPCVSQIFITKKGILHTPAEDDEMVILSGEDDLTLYQFGTKVARYTFCPRCGCNAFHRSRGNPYRYSVNARCLDDFDALIQNPVSQAFSFRHDSFRIRCVG